MQVFIILATVSLIIIFSILKYFEYRKENTEDCEGEWSWSECDKKCSDGDSVRYGTFNVTKEATFEGKCEAKMVNRKRKNVQLQNAPQRIVLEIGCGILNVLGIVVMKMLS